MAAVSNFIVCFHRDARMLFGRTVYGLRKVLRTVDAGVTLQQIILTKDQGYIANGPDGHLKLLHLWTPKVLQAERFDCNASPPVLGQVIVGRSSVIHAAARASLATDANAWRGG
jgi:hypothetical protein